MIEPELSAEAIETLRSLSIAQAETGATSDIVYRVLSEAIINGTLAPGLRLTEEQIAAVFSVSRTPVREALLRLEAERFAQRIPRRGLIVSRITPQEVLDVYVMREAIDGLAAALAAQHATPSQISHLSWLNEQFARAAHDGDIPGLVETNLRLHEAVGDAAHNSLLLNVMKQIHHLVRRFPSTTFVVPGRATVAVDEHRGIIAAISNREPALARELAERHMAAARGIRIAMVEQGSDHSGNSLAESAHPARHTTG